MKTVTAIIVWSVVSSLAIHFIDSTIGYVYTGGIGNIHDFLKTGVGVGIGVILTQIKG